MATIIHSKIGEALVPVAGSHRLKAALEVLGEAPVITVSGEELTVREVNGQIVALEADQLEKLRQHRKVNSGKPVPSKSGAPWYRRFDKRYSTERA